MRYQFLFFQGMGWASDNCNLNLNFFFLVNTPRTTPPNCLIRA